VKKLAFFRKFISVLFLLLLIWGGYYLATLSLQRHVNENLDYIPENAVFAARVDGSSVLKTAISSIVLSEDEAILKLINASFERKGKTKDQDKKLGIDFNSDIILFTSPLNNNLVFGVLLNLKNKKRFTSNIPNFLSESQSFATTGNIGLILTERPIKGTIPLTSDELKIQAARMLSKKSEFELDKIFEDEQEDCFVKTWSNKGFIQETDIISNSNLTFHLNDQQLVIKGDLKLRDEDYGQLKHELKPKGLHFSSLLISESINDSLRLFLESLNIDRTNVQGISFNYYETTLVEEPSFFIVPKFDALISLTEKYSIRQMLDSLENQGIIKVADNKRFVYGASVFYYKQLDSTTVFIGSSPDIEYIPYDSKYLFKLEGGLSHLTTVKGKGLMRVLLEAIPLFSASKELSRKVESINFTIVHEKGKPAKLEGTLKFKDEYYALTELLKFALNGQLIK